MSSFSPTLSNAAAYSVPMTMGVSSQAQMEQQQMQMQANEFLPSISPSGVYSTAHAVWSSHELQVLHKGFANFPADKFDNVTRYIKIAATLPGKCVRDVAFKTKALALAHESMLLNRDQYAKRMKIVPYQQASSSKLVFPSSAGDSAVTAPPAGESPEDAQFAALLQDNMLLMSTMRSNLLSGQLDANRDPMAKFRDNCNTVLSGLGDIYNAIPPLPIKLDTSLIPTSAPATSSSNCGGNASTSTSSEQRDG